MSKNSKLSPTVFLPPGSGEPTADAPDAEVAASPTPRADAPPGPEHDADLISGVSLTFHVLPLGGAQAARGFEPFALP